MQVENSLSFYCQFVRNMSFCKFNSKYTFSRKTTNIVNNNIIIKAIYILQITGKL